MLLQIEYGIYSSRMHGDRVEVFRMKHGILIVFAMMCSPLLLMAQAQRAAIPHLEKHGTATQLVVDGEPFLMLANCLDSERKLLGHGVSTCATCDGYFFRGKDVAVVGGGDTAAEDALFLTRYAKEVSIIHRREQLRASKIMQDRLHRNEKIKFIWNSKVEDILDADKREVSGIKLRNIKTEDETIKPVDGVFIGIGHEPNTRLFRGQLEVDDLGYLITRDGSKTNISGVFAAGDVKDRVYRQAITASGSGCMAAMDAEKFLEAEH